MDVNALTFIREEDKVQKSTLRMKVNREREGEGEIEEGGLDFPDESRPMFTSGEGCVPARLVGVHLVSGGHLVIQVHLVSEVHFVRYRGCSPI